MGESPAITQFMRRATLRAPPRTGGSRSTGAWPHRCKGRRHVDGCRRVTVGDAAATDADDSPGPSWTRILTIASCALAVVALTITIWSVGPRTLLTQLQSIGWGFVAVLLVEVLVTGCDAAALFGFLGSGGRRPSFWHVVRAQVVGRAINAVTPLGSLGEAAKATTLMERTSTQRAIAAVVRYNLTSVGVRLVVIVIGAPICAAVLDLPHALTVALVGGSAVAALVLAVGVALVRHGLFVTLASAARRIRLVSAARAKRWHKSAVGLDRRLARRSDAGRFGGWGPAGWVLGSRALSLVSLWIVLASAGFVAGPGTMAAIATAGTLIGVIASVVPMGLGITEGSNAALFVALDAPAALGVTMVLGGRVTLIIYAAIGAALAIVAGLARARAATAALQRRRGRGYAR